jgi:dCMP deaminase
MKHEKLISIAECIAQLSKDPSTKVGAIVFDDDSNILSTGFNGIPRGVSDNEYRYNHRETKYKFVCHAEANAIAQAARVGARLLNSNMIVTSMYPCSNCAKLIIQSGIKKVYVPTPTNSPVEQRWREDIEITTIMFHEAGVTLEEYNYDNDG